MGVKLVLTLREERGLRRVFENRVVRKIFGPKREWIRLHNRSFMICTPHQILFR